MKIKEILKVTGGELVSGDRSTEIDLARVSTDSRTIKKGDFFIALTGPNFRGSLFVRDAFKKGAIGAIVDGSDTYCDDKNILIRVKSAATALTDIARAHRAKFKLPLICVTGSNGKTTVKDMIAALLSTKYKVLKNEGTKNNHIGVPLTLLRLDKSYQICVMELGTNHKGEIKKLVDIAVPTVAVITNIGPSHLEHLIDLEGVYEEKTRILGPLGKGALAVINGDDTYLSRIKSGRFKVARYGSGRTNDFRASAIHSAGRRVNFKLNESTDLSIKLLGVHNVYNVLAAIAVARNFNVSISLIKRTLLKLKPAYMRLNPLMISGVSIINDSYNSNPASMKAALEVVLDHPAGAKWVVSGDMLELGREAERFHRLVGSLIADSTASGLITMGRLSRFTQREALACGMNKDSLWHYASHDEIASRLRKIMRSGDMVLIKGSRSMKMEKIIEKLKG